MGMYGQFKIPLNYECECRADEPDGYLEWFKWSAEQQRLGRVQVRCARCIRFRWVDNDKNVPSIDVNKWDLTDEYR